MAAPGQDVRYIGLVTRAIAFAVDAAIINLVAIVVGIATGLAASALHVSGEVTAIVAGVGGFAFVVWSAGYFALFWSSTGQTPGNRLMRFRVAPAHGDKLGFGWAVLRYVGLVLAAIPLFLGYLPIVFDHKRRGLQDFIARTVVVDAPSRDQVRSARRRPPPGTAALPDGWRRCAADFDRRGTRAPARIPDDELRGRPALLGAALARAGFDGWIAFADDRAVFGPDHVRYLVDLEPHFEPVFLAAPVDAARCLLLTGPETVGYAAVVTARASVQEIVAIDELVHPEEEYPTIEHGSGGERLRELFAGARRIATLGASAVPEPVWRRLTEPLAAAGLQLASADDVAYGLRAVKTAAEQAVIDAAYAIAHAGMLAAAAGIRPGVTERWVAAQAEAAMRGGGAEGFGIDTMVASGVDNTRPILARSTFRMIAQDDLVTVTLAPRYEGYHAAIARAFLLRANRPVQAAIDAARRAQRAGVELLTVGAEGRDAARAVAATLDAAATGAELPYVPLHSIGLIEFEPPIFMSSSSTRIAAGMALSIDAALFHGAWGGLRLEDGFAIGPDGARPRIEDHDEIVPVLL